MLTAVYSHGRDGHPWLGQKIVEMRPVVLAAGINLMSIRYEESETIDDMVEKTVEFCRDEFNIPGDLILIGSSRGAYISIETSRILEEKYSKTTSGLFLIAPALYIKQDYYPNQDPKPRAKHVEIVHGWVDPIIPVDNSIKFARKNNAAIHILDDEHRLNKQKRAVSQILSMFLESVKEKSGL